jgi:hypothetical protein
MFENFAQRGNQFRQRVAGLPAIAETNRPQVMRLLRRMPIAAIIMYLFLTNLFASGVFGLAFWLVLIFLVTCLVTIVLNVKPLARVLNWPIRVYMGRNNYLLAWLFLFATAGMVFWFFTEPEPVEVPSSVTMIPLKQVDSEAEQEKLVLDRVQLRVQQNNERYENKRAGRGSLTNDELKLVEENSKEERWEDSNRRAITAILLLSLIPLYIPFASSDEAKRAFEKVSNRMFAKPEDFTKPVMYDAFQALFKAKVPSFGTTNPDTGAKPARGFWYEIFKEILAEKVVDMTLRRR